MTQGIVTRSDAFFSFHPTRLSRRILPVTGLAFAVMVNAVWIVFLGFEFYKLIF
jgi:hypothetical protein